MFIVGFATLSWMHTSRIQSKNRHEHRMAVMAWRGTTIYALISQCKPASVRNYWISRAGWNQNLRSLDPRYVFWGMVWKIRRVCWSTYFGQARLLNTYYWQKILSCDHLIQRKGIGFGAFRGTFCFDPLVGRQNDTWKWQLTHPTYSCPSMPFLAHYTLLYDEFLNHMIHQRHLKHPAVRLNRKNYILLNLLRPFIMKFQIRQIWW